MGASFVNESMAVLERTPALDAMLRGLPAAWIEADEGPGTWSPYIVVAHLIHTENTNWMPRLETILGHGAAKPFPPFDQSGQLRYEDLVAEPARAVREIAAWAGEAPIEHEVSAPPSHTISGNPDRLSVRSRQEIRLDDEWSTRIETCMRRLVEERTRPWMERYAYGERRESGNHKG